MRLFTVSPDKHTLFIWTFKMTDDAETDILRLLMEHRSAIYTYILAITRDTHASEDIFQETSMAVWKKRQDFIPGTSFKAWSREIARREILARKRKDVRFPVLLSDEEMTLLIDSFEEYEVEFALEEYVDALKNCADKMRPKERNLINLRYSKEFSHQQISDILGIGTEGVRKFLFRVRKKLKQCVEFRIKTASD